ncbi:hypothetical protein DFH09DRAFT_874493, partial [Mycena vulgaris]
ASINAIAVLENPRLIPKTKSIVFDAQAYLGSSEPALIASLRYFNADNREFAEFTRKNSLQLITMSLATSSRFVFLSSICPNFHSSSEMVPLGSPENFDLRHHAIVHVCGLPTNIDKKDSTFELHIEQYLSATKTADNSFPVRCLFPATPRWEKYKPIPGRGKSVAIEGLLTGLERNEDKTVKHFIVDLEKVTFLGQTPTAPKAEESPTK